MIRCIPDDDVRIITRFKRPPVCSIDRMRSVHSDRIPNFIRSHFQLQRRDRHDHLQIVRDTAARVVVGGEADSTADVNHAAGIGKFIFPQIKRRPGQQYRYCIGISKLLFACFTRSHEVVGTRRFLLNRKFQSAERVDFIRMNLHAETFVACRFHIFSGFFD